MQIPVEGGYVGGRLNVENDDGSYFFDSDNLSDQHFYCTAFFSNYKHEWQPILRGCMMALEFDLLWHPTAGSTNSSLILPDYLTAVKLCREALNAWETLSEESKISRKQKKPTACQSQSKMESDESLEVGFSSDEDPNPPPPSVFSRLAARDHLLIIPLTGTYYETSFSFSSLRGNDRKMVHVLQSIDYVDVHLAILNQDRIGNSQTWEVKTSDGLPPSGTFQIAQWIYSNTALPQFQLYNLNFPNQLVGDIKSILKSEEDCKERTRHPVLVLQPLRQSIRRCCLFQFDAVLDHIESRLLSDGSSKFTHLQSVQCLAQIIDFCRERPLTVWDIPDAEATERTRRLLLICNNLQAQKEGILLMQLLGIDFPKQPKEVFYEGVRNKAVAHSIVKMICNIGGIIYLYPKF